MKRKKQILNRWVFTIIPVTALAASLPALTVAQDGLNSSVGGFIKACCYGHIELIEVVLQKNTVNLDLNMGLCCSASSGNFKCFQLILRKNLVEMNLDLNMLTIDQQKEFVKTIIKTQSTEHSYNIDYVKKRASQKAGIRILEFLI